MTRAEAILWMRVLKHSKINWVGEKAEEEDIITRCKEAEQEAFDMAIEALSADTVSRDEYEEVKAYMDTLVDAFIEDGEELAESVKVVRCKDCKWYDNRDVCHNPRYGDGHANYSPPYVDEEYWCKDGERSE